MQANRDNARFLRTVKDAHYLWPVLGNQPSLSAQLTALPWETTPAAAATSQIAAAASRPAPSASCPHPPHRLRRRPAGPPHRAVHRRQEERPLAHRLRGRPLPHQPRRRRNQPGRPPRPHPRPLAGRARPLATRRDLERRQITHPHRKRTPGLVRPRQPRHHPLPNARSNQLHRRDPPHRPGPPPRTRNPQPPRLLTSLNTSRDFDESLHRVACQRSHSCEVM
jgi:hypothetical protein